MAIYVEDSVVCIRHNPNKSPYPIEVERCDTYAKIAQWIAHLSEDTWCTREIIYDFIEVACGHHELNYHKDGAAQ